jgi:hypothetical protein
MADLVHALPAGHGVDRSDSTPPLGDAGTDNEAATAVVAPKPATSRLSSRRKSGPIFQRPVFIGPDFRRVTTSTEATRRGPLPTEPPAVKRSLPLRAWACAHPLRLDARPSNRVSSPLVGEGQGEGTRAAARRKLVQVGT